MPSSSLRTFKPLRLMPGELVEVVTADEILATLDENGELDCMPFMPEMLQYCGKTFRVFKRADKTCDTVNYTGNRRLYDTVHLEGLRCDGQAHGGCQAGCFLFFKEAWLKRPGAGTTRPKAISGGPSISFETLQQKTRKVSNPETPADDVYSCQATELPRFTRKMAPWNVFQYIRDVAHKTVPFKTVVFGFAVEIFNYLQKLRKGSNYPIWYGSKMDFEKWHATAGKSKTEVLNLQPGDLVQIKERDEILLTLNKEERNRGLTFDREMVRFCGGKYRVLRKVEKIINEQSGKMMKIPNDCIILENVVCVGDLHRFCPRSIYPYWREVWLRRCD